ncbi:MAG: helix-turn-helix domain-containing protein [Paludibacteraceae bacterium]|nr:helix-turn-helix domain-containing protein [Paludibacteraceae bacterium]
MRKHKSNMTKSEFAQHAGISRRTLARWCKEQSNVLRVLHVKPTARVLNPIAILFLCDYFCVDRPEFLKNIKLSIRI